MWNFLPIEHLHWWHILPPWAHPYVLYGISDSSEA